MTEAQISDLTGCGPFLNQIKQQIQTARTQAVLAANQRLLELY